MPQSMLVFCSAFVHVASDYQLPMFHVSMFMHTENKRVKNNAWGFASIRGDGL